MKINEAVRKMYPPRYTTKQASDLVGRDVDTLKRWKRSGTFVPSDVRQFGETKVSLYTDDDIEDLRRIAKDMKPGRKTAV